VQAGVAQVCEESGTDLAQLVRKKVKVQQKQAATSQASSSAFSLFVPRTTADSVVFRLQAAGTVAGHRHGFERSNVGCMMLQTRVAGCSRPWAACWARCAC